MLDITDRFKRSCSAALQTGELVHDASFSLFEAMSAIELMDPKMDIGMSPQARNRRVVSFSAAVANGTLEVEKFEDEAALVATFDGLFSALATWLDGHSMAQSLLLNLYLHEPANIKHNLLRSFAVALCKTASLARNVVTSARAFEDEDFQASTFGFHLCSVISEARAITAVKDAEDEAEKQPLAEALVARLRLLRLLISALILLTSRDRKLLSACSQSTNESGRFDEASKYLKQCSALLLTVQRTQSLSSAHVGSAADDTLSYPGFVRDATWHLLPPTFPRQTRVLPCNKAIATLTDLVSRLQQIASLPLQNGSFDHILDSFRVFTDKETCVLSRAVFITAYHLQSCTPEISISQWINGIQQPNTAAETVSQHIRRSISCLNQWQYENEPRPDLVAQFVSDAVSTLMGLLMLCGHNRARQRDKLAGALEYLGHLQRIGHTLDSRAAEDAGKIQQAQFNCGALSIYCIYHTLKVMQSYLLLHFELDLLAPYEYPMIYWYLSNVVCKWQVNLLRQVLDDRMTDRKGKKTKKLKKAQLRDDVHRVQELNRAEFIQRMAISFFEAVIALDIDERLSRPNDVVKSKDILDCNRFEHRLSPFASVSMPPFVSYQQFASETRVIRCSSSFAYESAATMFDETRGVLEAVAVQDADLQAMIHVCKRNAVTLRVLGSGHLSDVKREPRMDFRTHRHFPVIVIT